MFEIGDLVLAVVCDGVGGHTGGQQAATLAVRTVAQAFQDGVTDVSAGLIEAITLANRTIYEAGRKSHRLMGMSTTIVAVAIRDDIAYVAHVGDSRAYLTRGTEIMPSDLPSSVLKSVDVPGGAAASEPGFAADTPLATVERLHILRVLEANSGNKVRTAKVLGINVKTLYNKLKSYEAAGLIPGKG